MKLTTEQLNSLRTFSEKATRLLNSSLAKEVLQKLNASVHWERGSEWTSSYSGPSGESVEAFILTLRFFIQNNEPTSLRRMRQLYETIPVDTQFDQDFKDVYSKLNTFLDSSTNLSIQEGQQLTHRDIFEFFVYGDLAHANTAKQEVIKALMEGAWPSIFQIHFIYTLRCFVLAITELKRINDDVLSTVSATT